LVRRVPRLSAARTVLPAGAHRRVPGGPHRRRTGVRLPRRSRRRTVLLRGPAGAGQHRGRLVTPRPPRQQATRRALAALGPPRPPPNLQKWRVRGGDTRHFWMFDGGRVGGRMGGRMGAGERGRVAVTARLPAYRTPVTPREEVICFWKIRNRITSGASAIVVAAITSVQLPAYWVCRLAVATVSTLHSCEGAMISGHMKLFHCVTTVISSSVAMIGLFIGTITCHSRRSTPAPSIVAASRMSCGVLRKFSRSRKIAYGEPNRNGSTRPAKVFFRPTEVIIE